MSPKQKHASGASDPLHLKPFDDDDHSYARVKHIDDLGKTFEKGLEDFFVNYHELSGKSYEILAVKGPQAGHRAVKEALNAARKEHA